MQPRPSTPSSIPLLTIRPTQPAQQLVRPRGTWLFAVAMAVSMVLAASGGLVLGVMAATQSGIAAERWIATVQAHGDVQLWAWTAVSVVALTFEFIIRLNRHPPFAFAPRAAVFVLLASGALASAFGRVAGYAEQPLAMLGSALLVAGSGLFAWMVFRVRPAMPLSVDLHPLFFRAAAGWLVLAAFAALAASLRMRGGVTSLADSGLVAEVFLRGFVTNIVAAVGLRAFPGHLGLPEVEVRPQRALWLLVNGSVIVWAATSDAVGLPGVEALQMTADLTFAAAMLWATWSFRIWRVVLHWGRRSERHQVMIPAAWAALLVYALALAAQALAAWIRGEGVPLLEVGAVRHIYMLGFMAPLLIAMSHVVLERFGVGRVFWQDPLTAAFALLVVAWPLRVLPPVLDPSFGELAQGAMGVAGLLVAVALTAAAAVAGRNAVAIFQLERHTARPHLGRPVA